MYTFTKKFRQETLKLTLKEMSAKTGVGLSTISAFENGKSRNYFHLLDYYSLCDTPEKQDIFLSELVKTVRCLSV